MARARHQHRQIADCEIEPAGTQRIFYRFHGQRLDRQLHARRTLVQRLADRRQISHFPRIRQRQPERARARHGVEALRVTQCLAHRIERTAHDACEFERNRRGLHARARADEQRVVEQRTQTRQRIADGGLRQRKPFAGFGEAALIDDRLKHAQQIEVDVIE